MSNKKWGKNLLYDDYEDDLVDYDNYDEEHYTEFDTQGLTESLKTKEKYNAKGNTTRKKPNQVKKPNKEKNPNQVKEPNKEKKSNQVKEPNKEKKSNQDETPSNVFHDDNHGDNKGNRCIMLSTLNILVLGHIDAGKSTLIGALLYNLSYVSEQTVKKYEHIRESSKYTFILDEDDDERERNITLFNKKKEFYIYYTKTELEEAYNRVVRNPRKNKKRETTSSNYLKEDIKSSVERDGNNVDNVVHIDRTIFTDFYKRNIIHNDVLFLRKVNIFDTPGHDELVTNLHTWSFFADSAILVVDANNIYRKKNDETYRNVSILKSVGISNVIVVVNKLDLFDYDVNVFEDICNTIRSFFQCPKNNSIYDFLLSNNFYVRVSTAQTCGLPTETERHTLFQQNLTFIPLSAYKNINIVKFEKYKKSLLNRTFCLYDEIKYMNLRKDLFQLKVCAEILNDKKTALTGYYNFVNNNNLFANNIFWNFYQDDKGDITNSMKKSSNDEDTFVGVIQDLTESNNMINASVKVLYGFLKSKCNYVLLPIREKITVKKIEKSDELCKYVNIGDLCEFLATTKCVPLIKKMLEQDPRSSTLWNNNGEEEEEKKKKKKKGDHTDESSGSDSCCNAYKDQGVFEPFLNVLPNLLTSCCITKNAHITNDIVENVFFKIDDNKIKNGSVFVNNTVSINSEERSPSYVTKNITFACNKMKVLIKMNQVKIPLIIGRQYLLYSLNFSHSITIQNIYYVYENKKNSLIYDALQPENKLNVKCNKNDLAQISNLKNYVKNQNVLYEKMDKKKCLRSHDIGLIEIHVNDNSFMCIQHFRDDINYYISQDNPFFSAYDLLSCSISPLSRLILSEENKIVASGLVISEA
ncbi:elongation factor Tu [Plasmodium gonderi]|uniref:Elongation factor Tu n=1 Tax=Plasmodium gonderi TaxID=77519 RepID=A0A1Y1JGA8_PLAGO|nr:elongation factor Tu [Plasmodium gonderi]GAW80375.1 elongation factor Tu [Plasmodium gonderi]